MDYFGSEAKALDDIVAALEDVDKPLGPATRRYLAHELRIRAQEYTALSKAGLRFNNDEWEALAYHRLGRGEEFFEDFQLYHEAEAENNSDQ